VNVVPLAIKRKVSIKVNIRHIAPRLMNI